MKKPALNKLWEKNFIDLGLRVYSLGDYRMAVALDARRIIIGVFNELNFLNFSGEREKTIKTDNHRLISARSDKTSSILKVSSDCSKILLWVPDRFGVKSYIVFNPAGEVISEFDPVGGVAVGDLSTSLDGGLLVSSGKDIGIWDWNGNVLGLFRSSIDIFGLKSIMGTNFEFNSTTVTPDGNHIVLIVGGSPMNWGLYMIKTPDIDKLLNIDEAQRSGMWKDLTKLNIDLVHLNSTILAANNRLALFNGGAVSIIDFSEDRKLKFNYDYDFTEKGKSKYNFFITSNGKFIYYTSIKGKEIAFNIFDVENKVEYCDLLKFTIESFGNAVYFIPSHDGKKLVEVTSKGSWRHKENNISLFDFKYN